MSTKIVFSLALGLALLGVYPIRAQYVPTPSLGDPTHVPPPASADSTLAPAAEQPPAGLSSWIMYTHPDCCGPVGNNGPVKGELYWRTGPSVPVEGKLLSHILDVGWDVAGGGRSLFFNPQMTAAWTIDLGLNNIRYQGQRSDIQFPLDVLLPGVNGLQHITTSLRNFNMTFADLWLGREWYPGAPANTCWCNSRIGFDIGGGYGTMKAEFGEIHEGPNVGGMRHRTGIGALFGSDLHGDLEFPHGCCTYLLGFRTEWEYNWTNHVLQANNGRFEVVNFLLTGGVRF
jgi:hypothetical protein